MRVRSAAVPEVGWPWEHQLSSADVHAVLRFEALVEQFIRASTETELWFEDGLTAYQVQQTFQKLALASCIDAHI